MIELLGKRPFVGRSDDMDKWLDENHRGVAPPLPETPPAPEVDEPLPSPVVATATLQDRFRF